LVSKHKVSKGKTVTALAATCKTGTANVTYELYGRPGILPKNWTLFDFMYNVKAIIAIAMK
jgi:hypothetical protein